MGTRRFIALAALLAACHGHVARMPALPPPETFATLVGPMCRGGGCRCRTTPEAVGAPGSRSMKRYEVRIGPIENDLWVTIGDDVLYKTRERATECFYIDLATQQRHPVKVRARGQYGFAARVAFFEMGPPGHGWYEAFHFECGGPDLCSLSALQRFKAEMAPLPRGITDPCGSSKVHGIAWQTDRIRDRRHPTDLLLQFELEVYDFVPKLPAGAPGCRDRI